MVFGRLLSKYDVKIMFSLTLKRKEGVICSYLLHGYDVIRILKLCIGERSEAEFFCAV